MKETPESVIGENLERQRAFFASHQTKSVRFRLIQLKKLRNLVVRYEEKIIKALHADLGKSPEEAFLTEISVVTGELDHHIKNLKRWSRPRRVSTPVHLLPSSGKVLYEPLGIALIVSPWNYPFQLLFNPLIGAISAGCCSILKPSPDTPAVASLMEEMICECFPSDYIAVLQGGKETNTLLLKHRFDIIFFTGSPRVGKVFMKAAAEHLTPVVLELGGKSPCIVDQQANLNIAAKRIAWGKLINAGQTCIAPDYLLVHESVKEELMEKIVQKIESMYGPDISKSRFYPRIVNERAMERLTGLIQQEKVRNGGEADIKARYMAPTLLDNVKPEDPVMQEEVFGPILPVITFGHIDQATDYINRQEKPLALYYFGKRGKAKAVLSKTTSGGGCINDTLMHVTNHNLPFGGVGNSGTGRYHGKDSFLAFSNRRSIVSTPTWVDLPVKYVPFKYFKLIKRLLK